MDADNRTQLEIATHRIVYRCSYALFLATGHPSARLAAAFRDLGAASRRLGPLVLALQLPVFACWLVVRPLSLASFAVCSALAPRLQH